MGKYKVKSNKLPKYEFGVQKVNVPPKGDGSNVIAPIATMTAAGATFGPIGAGVGAVVGAGVGIGSLLAKNSANRMASNFNHNADIYDHDYNRQIDPKNQPTQTYKKGTSGIKIKKYPGGTSGIQLTDEEKSSLQGLDGDQYRSAVWNIMGYSPKKYPQGSDGWKTQEDKYNTAVDLINQGFRPIHNEEGESIGYKRKYKEGTSYIEVNQMEPENHAKPIEVEKDELVFKKSKTGRFLLKADFKGGKTHAQGGEDYVIEEGDVIFPGKQRQKVMEAFKSNDNATLERMRLKLPKDKAKEKAADGLDLSYGIPDNPYLKKTVQPPLSPNGVTTPQTNTVVPDVKSNIGNALSTIGEMAPTIYNTFKGLSKPVQTTRRYFSPSLYNKVDRYEPLRREVKGEYNLDANNIKTMSGGSLGVYLSNMSQAGNRRFSRMQDINNNMVSGFQDIDNANTDLKNNAKMFNLQQGDRYDDLDLRNHAAGENMLAAGTTGLSAYLQQRNWDRGMTNRDNSIPLETEDYKASKDPKTGRYVFNYKR
jgi:hypothetical protein